MDIYKEAAALAAVEEVQSGMVLGLGTGSTAEYAVVEIGRRLEDGRLESILAIPTSVATAELARALEIPLLEPGDAAIDLAIDGADEIAPDLALIKGGGGALLREKIIDAAAARFAVISDSSKVVAALGTSFPIPVEVAQFGIVVTVRDLERLGSPEIRLRNGKRFVTDNGNYVIDLSVDPVKDPAACDAALQAIPGVLATGLFIGLADVAYVAGEDGVTVMDAHRAVTNGGG